MSIDAERLRTNGLLVILAVVALRAMVVIEPQVWFADVDPALDAMPLLAMAQRGSLQLDLILLGGALAALLGEHRSGRGVHPWMVLLALLPMPVVLFHAVGAWSGNAFRGSTWLAGMVAFVAVAHLVRERRLRVVAVSVLVGLVAALAVRGAVQVLVEHPAMVAMYRETRADFLAERGWPADSSAALTYERRLMQPEATGWFALSNPYSTMMGVGVVALGALTVLARRTQQSGNTLLLALGAAGCAALLAVNGGKGAIVATGLAAAALVLVPRLRQAPRGSVLLAACAGVLLLVVLRGLVGEGVGERSLLFRAFYLEAGIRMLAEGTTVLLGVGPDQVQDAFAAAKPAVCPEDVKSLHSVFADWIVALGVATVAWIGAMWFAFRAPVGGADELEVAGSEASGVGAASDGESQAESSRRLAFGAALAIGVASVFLQLVVEAPTVDVVWFVYRALGVAVFALVAAVASQACAGIGTRALGTVAFALAALVLVHGQIEMVLWAPGTAALALVMVAAGSTLGPLSPLRPRALGAISVLAAAALAANAFFIFQAVSRDGRLASAAALLVPLAEARGTDAARAPEFPAREISARLQAAEILATRDWVASVATVDAAARQFARLALLDASRRDEFLDRAWSLAGANPAARPSSPGFAGPPGRALRADIAMLRLRESRLDALAAIQCMEAVAVASAAAPHNPRRRMDLAVALEALLSRPDVVALERESGGPERLRAGALAAYREALAISEALRLDPLAQLSEREQSLAESAVARLGGGAAASTADAQRRHRESARHHDPA